MSGCDGPPRYAARPLDANHVGRPTPPTDRLSLPLEVGADFRVVVGRRLGKVEMHTASTPASAKR